MNHVEFDQNLNSYQRYFTYIMSSIDERAPLFGPSGISPPTHRGLLGSIGHSQPNRGRKPVGLVCLLLIMFLQSFGLNPEQTIRNPLIDFFNIDRKQFNQEFMGLIVISVVLVYFLPMCVGLYADTYAGRYKALFLGIGLKLTGSVLGFILLLVFNSVDDMGHIAIKVLFAIFVVSCIFTIVGLVLILPSILSFAAQQVEPTFYGISSFVRWAACVISIGVLASDVLKYSNRPDFLRKKNHYYETIFYAIQFGCDALSIAIFLFGKIQYTIVPTEEGENSWKEVVRIVKTHVCRSKSRVMQGDDIFRSILSGQQEQTLDKLKLRKAVLFIVLMSCFALAITISIVVEYIVRSFQRQVIIPQVGWARRCRYLGFIFGALVIEIVFRKYRVQLKPDTTANQLRTIAVGTALEVIALIAVGVIIVLVPSDSGTTLNACWFIPPFAIFGLAGFIVFTSTATLCYLASPKGMGTFVCTILLCLSVLMFALETLTYVFIDLNKYTHLEIICFSIAGIVAVVFLVIFYPMSCLFLRTEKNIKNLLEPDDLDETTSIKLAESTAEPS